MYLAEIMQATEVLSLWDRIAFVLWGSTFNWKDFFDFFLALSGFLALIFGPGRWIINNIMKVSAPYRAYKDDIDTVLGEESRKMIEKYYIPTRGQDIDPCNEEEIRENNGKYNTEELIPFLCKRAFSEESFGKHYIILADSGMGKTTFLVNLYRQYVLKNRFWSRDRMNMRFIPLSSETCMEQIQKIDNQGKTILLLDALDESKDAMINCDAFLKELLKHTENFYRIVITCRTHFFSNADNEPENTGLIRVGTGDKNLKFTKKYITPFTDREVNDYLRKRFRFQFEMQQKAKEIVNKVPAIMARPLILNWIDCLLETDDQLHFTYEIYKTIIDRWINREPEALTKGRLFVLSQRIAVWMMIHATTCVPSAVVEGMAAEKEIDLLPIVAKSRSLLNRNSNGDYKFAHRSFLEYFLSEQIFYSGRFPENENYLHSMSGFRRFFIERLEHGAVHAMVEDARYFTKRPPKFRELLDRKTKMVIHYTNRTIVTVNSGERLPCITVIYAYVEDRDSSVVHLWKSEYIRYPHGNQREMEQSAIGLWVRKKDRYLCRFSKKYYSGITGINTIETQYVYTSPLLMEGLDIPTID